MSKWKTFAAIFFYPMQCYKKKHLLLLFCRPSPKWPVSKGAQSAEASDRVASLSQPKDWARFFTLHRPVMTTVSKGAQNASASDRIEHLATPKQYQPLKIKESWEFDCYKWDNEITAAAKNAHATERLESLAESKSLHNQFRFAKPVRWNTEDSTLKAIATLRIQQLARPKSRGKNEQFDPYKVSSAAVHARPTPRIDELCLPIPRKIRQKKAGGTWLDFLRTLCCMFYHLQLQKFRNKTSSWVIWWNWCGWWFT